MKRKIMEYLAVAVFVVVIATLGFWSDGNSERGLPGVIKNVRPSVVHITHYMELGGCQGSGVAITNQIVMTARHVTDGGFDDKYVVTTDDGKKYDVIKVLEDLDNDIAYLKIVEPNLVPADLAKGNPIIGQLVVIFGSPLGFPQINTASPGYVTALNRDLKAQVGPSEAGYEWCQMIQSNAPAYPGNSGGPVFDLHGDVVGILVAGVDATLNWSVPVERFNKSLNQVELLFLQSRYRVEYKETKEKQEPEHNNFYHGEVQVY